MQKYNLLSFEGEFDYLVGLMLQDAAISNIKDLDTDDYLILLSHKPVITLGHFAKEENVLMPKEILEERGISVCKTDRGGDVTYHGPGQLVGYPIINLQRKKMLDYKSSLCKSLIDTLKDYGIVAEERDKKLTGIWVGEKKIASIGYAYKKFPDTNGKIITKHGFALYVKDDMDNFKYINPCGMPGLKLTSIEEQLGKKISIEEVKRKYIKHFEGVFKYGPK